MRTRGATCAFLAIQSRLSSKPHSFSATYGVLSAADSSASSHTGESVRKILVLDPACSNFDDLERAGIQVTAMEGVSNTELERILPAYDALVVRSANCVTRSMLVASPRVAVVGRAGSGVDNIDLAAAEELGIPVVNAPTGNAGSVAELVLGLMLSVSRSIPSAHDSVKRGEWAKRDFNGRTLNGKILGIVGFGSVGQELARLAVAFGMKVMIANERRPPSSDGEGGRGSSSLRREAIAKGIGVTDPSLALNDLLPKCDFLSLHVPLTRDTQSIIAEQELGLMKSSAVVVNAARGGVVDERALLAALEEGRLGGAAMDVFASEKAPLENDVVNLCRLPNVVCTPHIGGSTKEAGERVLAQVCEAVVSALNGTLSPERVVNGSPDPEQRSRRIPSNPS